MTIIVLGEPSQNTLEVYRPVSDDIYVQGVDFERIEDITVSKPVTIVIDGMIPNHSFYKEAFSRMSDQIGIIYGDYVSIQDGYKIVRLNNSYCMSFPNVPLLGSAISPSFFYQITDFMKELKSCNVSTKIDPNLSIFADCCPQHFPGVAFII
jgi:hypothetical protein